VQDLVKALLTRATAQGLLVVLATLILMHVGQGRARPEPEPEEAEEALRDRRLPHFVHKGLRTIVYPPTPPPVPPFRMPLHER
jgi:hypothetical protein